MAKLSIGDPAPLFRLSSLQGQSVGLADFVEQVVLINFWSAECPHAARADQELVSWQERVVLLNIACNANEPPELLRPVADEHGLKTVLLDPDQHVANLYGAEITPQLFLVDGGGILRYQGALDDVTFRQRQPTRSYINEAIEALLQGNPVPISETPPYGCTIVRKFAET